MIAPGRHRAGVRIGERDLLVGGGLQLSANLLKLTKPATQKRQSLGQVFNPGSGRTGLRTVGFLKLGEIARDALLDMGLPARQLAPWCSSSRGVFTARRRDPSIATMPPPTKPRAAADGNKALTCDLDRTGIVAAEVGNSLEVRAPACRSATSARCCAQLRAQASGLDVS